MAITNDVESSEEKKRGSAPISFDSQQIGKTKALIYQKHLQSLRRSGDSSVVNSSKKAVTSSKTEETRKKIHISKRSICIILGSLVLFCVVFIASIFISRYLIPTNKSQAEAIMILETNPEEGIRIIDNLIIHAENNDEKAILLLARAEKLKEIYHDEYRSQILDDLHKAEKLSPSADTASAIAEYEILYGSTSEAEYWNNIADERNNSAIEEGVEGRG